MTLPVPLPDADFLAIKAKCLTVTTGQVIASDFGALASLRDDLTAYVDSRLATPPDQSGPAQQPTPLVPGIPAPAVPPRTPPPAGGSATPRVVRRIQAAVAALVLIFGVLVAPQPAQASLWAQCETFRFCVFTSYYGSHSEYPFCQFTETELRTQGFSMPSACNNNSKSWYNNTRLSIVLVDGDGCNAHSQYWHRTMVSGQRASGEGSDWINRVSSIIRVNGPDFCGV